MTKEDNSNYVTVYNAQGKLDGESIKGFLEAQGIPTYLDINALGQIYGLTVGDLGVVGVMVSKENEARARDLLIRMESGEYENEVLLGAPLTLVPGVDEEEDVDREKAEEDHRRRVLFLCTGNSARSQLAEAIVNFYLPNEWVAFSAGSEPTGYVHPMASKVLQDAGIEHHGYSKPIDDFLGQEFDMVITLCDQAREQCPLWLKKGGIIHLGFSDPALFEGTDEQKLQVFKDTFEAIRATVISYLEDIQTER